MSSARGNPPDPSANLVSRSHSSAGRIAGRSRKEEVLQHLEEALHLQEVLQHLEEALHLQEVLSTGEIRDLLLKVLPLPQVPSQVGSMLA
jgi:hypothetical protein